MWLSLWRVLLLSVLLLLALLTPLLVILESAGGSRFFLEQILPLQQHFRVAWRSGRLQGPLRLYFFEWRAAHFRLYLQDVRLDSDFSQFWHARLPLHDVHIAYGELDLPLRKPAKTVLKSLWLPLELSIDQLRIDALQVHKGARVYAGYALDGQDMHWLGHDLRVQHIVLRHALGQVDLGGRIQLRADYPVQASGRVSGPWLQAHGLPPWHVELTHTIADLQVQGYSAEGHQAGQLQARVAMTTPGLPYHLDLRWQDLLWPWWPHQEIVLQQSHWLVEGTLNHERLHLDAQAQGRYLLPGHWQFDAQGEAHHLHISHYTYEGLGGQAEGDADLRYVPGFLSWQVRAHASAVQLQRRWPALRWILPQLQGVWRSEGVTTPAASRWTMDADAGHGELWHGQSSQPGAISRLDLPLRMDVHIARLPRRLAGRQLVLSNVQASWRGPWLDHSWRWSADARFADVPVTHVEAQGRGRATYLELQHLNWHGPWGQGQFDGQAAWQRGPWWQGVVSAENVDPALLWPAWPGRLHVQTQLQGRWQAGRTQLRTQRIRVDGLLRGQPLQVVSAGLMLQQDTHWHAQIDALQARLGRDTLQGHLLFAGHQWQGHVQVDAPDLAWLEDGEQGSLALDWQLQSADPWLGYGHIEAHQLVHAGIQVQDMDINVDAQHADIVRWSLVKLSRQGLRLDHLSGQAEGSWRQAHIDAELQWQHLLGHGRLDAAWTAQGWRGQMLTGQLQAQGMSWQLRSPFAWSYDPALTAIRLQPQCWMDEQASFCIDHEVVLGRQGQLAWSLRQLPLSTLQAWMPEGVHWQGLLNGQGEASWQDAKPLSVHGDLGSQNGQLILPREHAQDLILPYQQAQLQVSMQAAGVELRAQLDSQALGHAQVLADMTAQSPHTLQGQVDVDQLDLHLFQAFLPHIKEMGGGLSVHAQIAGDLKHPVLVGQALLSQAYVQDEHALFNLQNIQGHAEFNPENAHFVATFQSGQGHGQLQGQAQWPDTGWSIEGRLRGQDLQLVHPPVLHSRLDPDIHFELQAQTLVLDGRVRIPEADIEILDQEHGSLDASPDLVRLGEEQQAKQPWHLLYDLSLQLGEQVRFKGYGADGRLHGAVQLSQDAQGGRSARGEITLDPESSFRAYGQNLRIRKGRLLFVGPVATPQVDIEAIKEFDPNITVGVKVQGWSNQLQSTLISDNGLSSDEISSYLIFGHAPERQQALFGVNNNTNLPPGGIPGLGAPVADSKMAAVQIGAFGGQKVADTVGQSIGVRDLALTTEGAGTETQVALGGYVSPNLYLSYGVGVFTPVNSLTLRYRINQHFYLQAASAFQNAIDLFYTFKF